MTPGEALQVLQVETGYTAEQVEERYEKLTKINDPTKGGSFYLQCKVMGAKDVLLEQLKPPKS
jgi:hypothetical protein